MLYIPAICGWRNCWRKWLWINILTFLPLLRKMTNYLHHLYLGPCFHVTDEMRFLYILARIAVRTSKYKNLTIKIYKPWNHVSCVIKETGIKLGNDNKLNVKHLKKPRLFEHLVIPIGIVFVQNWGRPSTDHTWLLTNRPCRLPPVHSLTVYG